MSCMIIYFECIAHLSIFPFPRPAENISVDHSVIERRLSTVFPPPWLHQSPNTSGTLKVNDLSAPTEVRARLERTLPVEENEPAAGPSSHKSSFQGEVPRIHLTPSTRHHRNTNENFENAEVEELLAMLRESESLDEQGDILQYLVDTQGLDFNTGKRDGLSLSLFRWCSH